MLELDRIYHGDCLDLFPEVDDNSVDLVVTSPPYNCGVRYDEHDDDMKWPDYLDWSWVWLSEAYRVLKDGGRFCLNVLMDMSTEGRSLRVSPMADFHFLCRELGFNLQGVPVWLEEHRIKYTAWGSWQSPGSPYIYNPCEVVMIMGKGQWKRDGAMPTISREDFIRGVRGVWRFGPDRVRLTEATFPVALPRLCIDLLTYENDIVLDPFGGSGTTAIACIESGRRFVLFEKSLAYYERALQRIRDTIPPLNFMELRHGVS